MGSARSRYIYCWRYPFPRLAGVGVEWGREKGKDTVPSKINEDKMKKKEENIVQEKKE